MLTAKQHELLHFIQERLDASGISPSFEEMKEALGLKSKSGIHRLISALEERGFLRRLPNRARALEVLKVPDAAKPAVRNDRNPLPEGGPRWPASRTSALSQRYRCAGPERGGEGWAAAHVGGLPRVHRLVGLAHGFASFRGCYHVSK